VQREDWNKRYAGVENLWAAKPNRFLVAEVGELPRGRALDLACGEGQNAIWLGSLGWEVLGVDYSDVAIEKARTRARRDGVEIDFVCADLVTYEPEAEAFDLVLVLYLHIPSRERRAVLAKAASAVAPGGTFLLIGHDRTNLTDGVGGPSDPDILSTPHEIAAELPGLEIEKATTFLRDVHGEERDAIDNLVRARRRPQPQ
jgi:2-polyprenyl-3-methyl-5-hydroxy-6-metoxy-1,4-benzoquinol methylase